MEAIALTMVKYGFEIWVLSKVKEDSFNILWRNCGRLVLDNYMTDCMSNNWLYEKHGSIPLSGAIMIEILLGHILRINDKNLPKSVRGRLGPTKTQVISEKKGRVHKEGLK